jgi:hypothetical protein
MKYLVASTFQDANILFFHFLIGKGAKTFGHHHCTSKYLSIPLTAVAIEVPGC